MAAIWRRTIYGRSPRYRAIACPVSALTRSIRMYPRSHSCGSTSDSPPAYGLRSPGSASEPEYHAYMYSARFDTGQLCRHARPERRTHADDEDQDHDAGLRARSAESPGGVEVAVEQLTRRQPRHGRRGL